MSREWISSYSKNIALNIGWMGILRGFTKLSSFIKIAVAARILGPAGFGVYAVATLVLSLLEIFTETGINAVLIQDKKGFKKHLDTAWVMSVIRGIVISVLIVALALPIVHFFDKPEVLSLLILISFAPLIKGFVNLSVIKFQKEVKFKNELMFRTPIVALELITTILLLVTTRNASALIWGMLISSLFEVVISWLFIKPRPTFRFNTDIAKNILKRGRWVTTSGIFVYLYTQGDDWFVGKFFGAYSLGLYQVAYKLATLPIYETANIIIKVMFPAFVKIKDDITRLKRAYIKFTLATVALVIPFIIVVFIFTRPIVVFVFGNEWLSIVPVVRILLVYSGLMSTSGLSSGLFLSIKKQKYTSNIMLLALFTMLITIFPLSIVYGMVGVGYSVLISWIFATLLTLFYLHKTFKNV